MKPSTPVTAVSSPGGRKRSSPLPDTVFLHWLSGCLKPVRQIAEELGITVSAIYRMRSGHNLPSLELAHRIEVYSDGEVPMSSWVPRAVPPTGRRKT